MYRKTKIALLLLIGGIIGLSAYYIDTAVNHTAALTEYSNAAKALDGTAFTKIRIVEKDKSDHQWELTADAAHVDQNNTTLKNIGITCETEGGYGLLRITAGSGVMENESKNVSIRGHVRVESEKGLVLNTESLEWKSAEGSIVTGDKVKFEDKRFTVTGEGLDAQLQLGKVTILRDVHAILE